MAKFNPDSWPACWILSLIAQDNIAAFYHSPQWYRFKRDILRKHPHRCYLCERKQPARLALLRMPWEKPKGPDDKRPVAIVHHVNEVRQRPDLALSEYDEAGRPNVIVICPACHWNEHHKRSTLAERIPERW